MSAQVWFVLISVAFGIVVWAGVVVGLMFLAMAWAMNNTPLPFAPIWFYIIPVGAGLMAGGGSYWLLAAIFL